MSIITLIFILVQIILKAMEVESFSKITLLTIISYAVLTGIVVLPYILFRLIEMKYEYDCNKGVVILLFLWSILIYSIVMRREIGYYYYYSRYLAPYLSVIIVMCVYLIKDKSKYLAVIPLAAVLVLLPYSNVVISNQDDTRLQWSVLADVLNTLDDTEGKKVVLMEASVGGRFFFPIAAVDDVEIYPVNNVSMQEAIGWIDLNGKELFYISNQVIEQNDGRFSVRYRKISDWQEDDYENYSSILHLPMDFPKTSETITLYHMNL